MARMILLLLVVTGTGCLAAPSAMVPKDGKLILQLNERIDDIAATTSRLENQMRGMKTTMEQLGNRVNDLEKQVKGKGDLKSRGPGPGRRAEKPPAPSRQSSRPAPARPPQPSGNDRWGQPPSMGRSSGIRSRGGRQEDMWSRNDQPPQEGPSGISSIFSKLMNLPQLFG
ncbi:uncharacterized protein LOC144919662 [Branchiostoma floridae x Branchiostoma belcheri]